MTLSQPASEFRYWAFISYSHKDKSWGSWLHKALETYRVPKRLVGVPIAAGKIPARLTPIFRDRDELPTASDLGSAIEEALSQSWCLIVICSPESAKSRWVNEEVLAFQRLGRGERIHCLIVESGSDVAAPLVFPPALSSHAPRVDGRTGEPIAADARTFGDGRSGAKLKLIAGILGIGYDTLVQREHQRRHRNLFAVTCAALALVVVLAVSTLVAITSRRDAVDQRGHAENLVEFMIGDLRKKLGPDGKLATLDAVGKEALAYYASQKSEDLDTEALARRARALHMIGEVYDLRGELDEALKVFKQAADSTRVLLERDPNNGQRIFDHAQSVFWVGNIAYQRGNADIAEPAFQEYKLLAERLVAIDPNNEDWQAELGYANSNLGTLLYDQGRINEAGDVFVRELEWSRKAEIANPKSYRRQSRTAQAHAWLADVRARQGNFTECARNRREEIAVYEAALATDPKNNDAMDSLSVAERALGANLLSQGKLEKALEHSRRALDLAIQLASSDPENSLWLERTAVAYTSVAEILGYTGDLIAARNASLKAISLVDKLVSRDPSVAVWQYLWARSNVVEARLLVKQRNIGAALRLARQVVKRLDELPTSKLRISQKVISLAQALQLVGLLDTHNEKPTDIAGAWSRSIEILISQDRDGGPPSDAALAIAYLATGRRKQASPLLERLKLQGYKEPGYEERLTQFDAAEHSYESTIDHIH